MMDEDEIPRADRCEVCGNPIEDCICEEADRAAEEEI